MLQSEAIKSEPIKEFKVEQKKTRRKWFKRIFLKYRISEANSSSEWGREKNEMEEGEKGGGSS